MPENWTMSERDMLALSRQPDHPWYADLQSGAISTPVDGRTIDDLNPLASTGFGDQMMGPMQEDFATEVQGALGEGAVTSNSAGSGTLQFPQNLKSEDMVNWISFQIINRSGGTAADLLGSGTGAGMADAFDTSAGEVFSGDAPGFGAFEGIMGPPAPGGGGGGAFGPSGIPFASDYGTGEMLMRPQGEGGGGRISGTLSGDAGGTPGDTIALYLPAQVSTAYSFDYAMQDFSFVQTIAGGVRSIYNVLTQPGATESQLDPLIEGVQRIGLNSLFGAIDAAGQTVGMDPNSQQAFNSATRTVTNPHMELVFNSVNPRSFSFEFLLKPKSSSEASAIKDIIKKFKVAAHPSLSKGEKYYEFPDEFEIKYHFKSGENNYMHKIARCACTGINVAYGDGNGGFKTYESGQPLAVALSLSFQELELLTREKMEQGY